MRKLIDNIARNNNVHNERCGAQKKTSQFARRNRIS